MENLAVVMPVYNEEEIVKSVIEKWCLELDKLNIDYKLFAYNDGSKDNSGQILEEIANNNSKVICINKKNAGHGPTILKGFKDNAADFTWILQIDSDNEMEPEYFNRLWEKRNNYDFLIGRRENRQQPFSRKILSAASRMCVRLFYGKGVWDVNSPYRLMRSEAFIEYFKQIPSTVFSPNLMLSGITAKKKLRYYETPIPCQGRQTGEVSIQKMTILKAAVKSIFEIIIFSFKVK